LNFSRDRRTLIGAQILSILEEVAIEKERTAPLIEVIQIKTNRITLLAEREPINNSRRGNATPTRSYTLHLVALETKAIRLTDRVLIVQEMKATSQQIELQVLVAVDHHKAAQDEVANKKNNRKNLILKTLFIKNEKKIFIFLVVGFTFSAAQSQEITDALRYLKTT
jgi:hypothetical protein